VHSNRLAIARRNVKSYWASRLFVQPEGFNIPYDAERIHGISTELAQQDGISIKEVLEKFNIAPSKPNIVGQNVGFWT
jgi:hypothetical protein